MYLYCHLICLKNTKKKKKTADLWECVFIRLSCIQIYKRYFQTE